MSKRKTHHVTIQSVDNPDARLVYNEEEDSLDVFFGENESATGVELTDYILLRVNQKSGRAVSLTIRHFSILTEPTEYGPRSYPLDSLEELPESLHDLTLHLLTTSPVNQFLKLSHFQASPTHRVPLTYVVPHQLTPIMG